MSKENRMLEGVKLNTPLQKILAGVTILGAGYLAYQLFIPLVLGGLILFGLAFYKPIWNLINLGVWKSTKFLINNNIEYSLNRSYDYLKNDLLEFSKATLSVGTEIKNVESQLEEIDRKKSGITKLHASTTDPELLSQLEFEFNSYKEQYNILNPILNDSKILYESMLEVKAMREDDIKKFKLKMDAAIQKYNILKSLNHAGNIAKKYVGDDDSKEGKLLKESMKALQNSVNSYIVNIEDSNRTLLPAITRSKLNKKLYLDSRKKLIESYKSNRLEI
jgi:hypothetical protein